MNRYSRGVLAGSLRFHNNKFYIVFGTPDEGYFMTTAPSIKGPWKPLTHILKEDGWYYLYIASTSMIKGDML